MADRIGMIDPRMFVRDNAPVVEPRDSLATGAAVRQGIQLASDLDQRQLMRPVVEAQAAMAADPKVLQAQKDLVTQRAEAGKLELDKAKMVAKIPPNVLQANQELAKFGMQVYPDTGGVWSDAKSAEVIKSWDDLQRYQNEVAIAKMQDESIKEESVFDSKTGETRVGPMFGGKQVSNDASPQLKTWLANNNNFRQWLGTGKQTAPRVIEGLTPGTASPAPAGPPPAATVGATPAIPAVEARTAPTVQPATATATPEWGRVTKVEPPKAGTEKQGQAALAAGRMKATDVTLDQLQANGFDPAKFSNWAQEYLVGPLEAFKSTDQKTYEAAKSGWIQGLLRLESGAAIAQKEQAWYEKTFFPIKGDSPEVQKIKEGYRQDVERIVGGLARTGNLEVDNYLKVRDSAEQNLGGTAGAKGATHKPFTTSSGKSGTIFVAPDGVEYVVPAKTGTGTPYKAPATLPKAGEKGTISVEKKPVSTKSLRGF